MNDAPRTWLTSAGHRLIEDGRASGAFCPNLRAPDGALLGATFEYTVRAADGTVVHAHRYSEGAQGWLAWATAYRVEGDRLLRYTCMQEDREPWTATVRVIEDGLALESGS